METLHRSISRKLRHAVAEFDAGEVEVEVCGLVSEPKLAEHRRQRECLEVVGVQIAVVVQAYGLCAR